MRIPIALAAAALGGAAVLGGAAPAIGAAPPPGSLLQQFVQNQFQNCAAICPWALQGAGSVPAGVAAAPGAFLGAVGSRGPLAALGAGASTVTAPSDVAMTGIIGNDLNRVVPRFQNGVLIGIVDVLRLGEGTGSVDGLRSDLLAALQQPLPPGGPTPPPLTTPGPFGIGPSPRGPLEVTAVEATNVFFAGAFYVPELSMLGATQTANAAASTLASTGDPVAATGAGADAAQRVVNADTQIISSTVSTAATNIAASAGGGSPSTGAQSTGTRTVEKQSAPAASGASGTGSPSPDGASSGTSGTASSSTPSNDTGSTGTVSNGAESSGTGSTSP